MAVIVEMHTGDPVLRADVVAVSIIGSQANDRWEMRIAGPNGFERSFILEGVAGAHAPHAIGGIVRKLVLIKRP